MKQNSKIRYAALASEHGDELLRCEKQRRRLHGFAAGIAVGTSGLVFETINILSTGHSTGVKLASLGLLPIARLTGEIATWTEFAAQDASSAANCTLLDAQSSHSSQVVI